MKEQPDQLVRFLIERRDSILSSMKPLHHNIQLPPPKTSSSIVEALRAKKMALEKMIRDKFAQARLNHTKADVAQLSAALRQVKNSIGAAERLSRRPDPL